MNRLSQGYLIPGKYSNNGSFFVSCLPTLSQLAYVHALKPCYAN